MDRPSENSELRRSLGLHHVFCLASGAMISSGIFVLPGLAHSEAGPAAVVAYVLAGLLATPALLSVAEVTTAMPKAGGDYFFFTRSMGPAVGTVAGFLTWFSLSLKAAFALVGMAAIIKLVAATASLVFPGFEAAVGLTLAALFVGINLLGSREAARLQVALVIGLLALMVLFVGFGLGPALSEEGIGRLHPFAPNGWRGIFFTVGLVFVSFGGLLNVASIAEEVRQPGRTIPLGMLLSLVGVCTFYALMVFVTGNVLDAAALESSRTPIADAARVIMGRPGQIALGCGALLAFITTANGGILSASRYLLALSRDRLLPERLSRVGTRFQTPTLAVLVTGALIATAQFMDLKILVEAASTVLILNNILANVSVIILRESRVQNYRPIFRAPLYPWLQIAGVVGLSFLLFEMREDAFVISALLVVVGFSAYWFYGRRRTKQESAFLHLLERLTARDFVSGTLEDELKQIIRERDVIVQDRFDRLVEACPILDLDGPITREELLERAADVIAGRLCAPRDEILGLLRRRERQGSTVLTSWLALPHLVVDGEEMFDLLLVRCRGGVQFSDEAPAVKAVFILAGTRDERSFHLRALTAIAQIALGPRFEQRWLAAKDAQALRDLILLAERSREEPG